MGFMLASVVSLVALSLQASRGAAQQIVLDDMDSALQISSVNTFEGSFEPCLSDAYNGQFHHDWNRNKGEASFTIGFQPPRSGCYAIQEHHPGSDLNCRRYLPQNVSLTVDYCEGLSTTIYYDQSSPATVGKWNTLGMWMFFEGWSGALTMRNHAHEVCLAGPGQCFMVVDAFRLTRVGDTCADAVAPAPAPVAQAVPEAEATGATEAGLEHEGLLTLRLVGPTVDLQASAGWIGDALAMHLGMQQVSILSIRAASGRRLSGSDTSSFQVRFRGARPGPEAPAAAGLVAALQAAFDAAGLGVVVASAEVDWVAVYPSAPADADASGESAAGNGGWWTFWSVLALLTFAFLTLVMVSVACAYRHKAVSSDAAVDAEAPPEKPVDVTNPPESDKWDITSVSTGPPESESSSIERPSAAEAVEPVEVVGTHA
ncbi:unnamed protein product [Prorocentrum cordatum]|uniref:Uncharacterized protein n=1 Tax=Prorocentrum cordatum TaxID=2364126 RepID=A0ABN9W6W6_9DINO|nr:unnamed protein product [Polarella glacialis]